MSSARHFEYLNRRFLASTEKDAVAGPPKEALDVSLSKTLEGAIEKSSQKIFNSLYSTANPPSDGNNNAPD